MSYNRVFRTKPTEGISAEQSTHEMLGGDSLRQDPQALPSLIR